MRPLRTSINQWRPPARKLTPLDAVRALWPTLVGADVAKNAFPVSIDGETLVITTRSGAWSQQLGFLEARLMPQLQELPEVKGLERLVFRVGRITLPSNTPSAVPKAKPVQARLRLAPDAEPVATIEELSARIAKRLVERERLLSQKPRCRGCGIPLERAALCPPCLGRENDARQRAAQGVLREMPWLGANAVREMVPGLSLVEFATARRSLQGRMERQLDQLRWDLRQGKKIGKSSDRALAMAYTMLVTGEPPDALCDALLKHALGGPLAERLYGEGFSLNEEREPERRTKRGPSP
jgi:predicted nucleic acid-binding Zn ribbon protein